MAFLLVKSSLSHLHKLWRQQLKWPSWMSIQETPCSELPICLFMKIYPSLIFFGFDPSNQMERKCCTSLLVKLSYIKQSILQPSLLPGEFAPQAQWAETLSPLWGSNVALSSKAPRDHDLQQTPPQLCAQTPCPCLQGSSAIPKRHSQIYIKNNYNNNLPNCINRQILE